VRVLITGASGFAGSHLARACAAGGDEVVALSRGGSGLSEGGRIEVAQADLRDADAILAIVREAAPDVVYHLAALSSVGRSWEEPAETLAQNTATAVSVLEAVRRGSPGTRLLWASSCEVYGVPARLPLTEEEPLAPANPYAVSKAAGELLAGVYADAHGLDVIRVRPFSHAGPGQRPIFILSSLARQAAEARLAGAEHVRIVTGNPQTRRDFTDVRDVVRAYRLLAERAPAGIYNVSSGRSVSAAEQVQLVGRLIAPIEIEHVVDPARVRASEVMDLRGAHDRLTLATGWRPEIAFEQTMADTIAWWDARLAQESVPRA
jgi:GDP-4-dehydro-6-deoxy-D-mannose reductase